jgi:2-polyprenyl-6-methoxyphenol hydroxylase-like FAD-dependent oxidoreductase
MNTEVADVVVVGAGPVGLMCAHLGRMCGMKVVILDQADGPTEVGRADAMNARTLQLLELAGLFDELYPLGNRCNTSSVWANGKFVSRQSTWWEALEGCFHKHFLMLGQSYLEKLLNQKLQERDASVRRSTRVEKIQLVEDGCLTELSNGETIQSKYIIGADGSQSFVRKHFEIPFDLVRPQIVWAVIDGVVETDFPKAPEIIVFQADTSDVAWIPRERDIDRFYIRMDTKDFTFDEAVAKINRALHPHVLSFKKVEWFSQFSVKESVAAKFSIHDRVFLAGDACHVHSVNGGQGLNTGLSDAFNLMWKLSGVMKGNASSKLLQTYESERKPIAKGVIEASGELVRATKYSETGTHAEDYVKILERRSGNVTGMGIRYHEGEGLRGQRLFDFEVDQGREKTRLYSLLDYTRFTLLIFGDFEASLDLPKFVKVLKMESNTHYQNQAILVRPDSYIEATAPLDQIETLFTELCYK